MAITDSIKIEDCWTAAEVSAELGVGKGQFEHIKSACRKSGKVPWIVIKKGMKDYYPEELVNGIIKWRNENMKARGGDGDSKRAYNTARLVIQVPVWEADIEKALKAEFATLDEMSKFLQTKLEDHVKPTINELDQARLEYEKTIRTIMERKASKQKQ